MMDNIKNIQFEDLYHLIYDNLNKFNNEFNYLAFRNPVSSKSLVRLKEVHKWKIFGEAIGHNMDYLHLEITGLNINYDKFLILIYQEKYLKNACKEAEILFKEWSQA